VLSIRRWGFAAARDARSETGLFRSAIGAAMAEIMAEASALRCTPRVERRLSPGSGREYGLQVGIEDGERLFRRLVPDCSPDTESFYQREQRGRRVMGVEVGGHLGCGLRI